MAGTKRKSASPSKHVPKRVKPSVDIVEVLSDEVAEPTHRGPLRGLNLNDRLPAPTAEKTIELGDEDSNGDGQQPEAKFEKENRPLTRGSRLGRTDDRRIYDMKYHPMDEVTRPKLTAQRLSGSRSLSASVRRMEDADTSESSQPSLAHENSEDEASGRSSDVEALPARTPDPRATRHSIRSEANKPVNYSKKYHPQDYALPGFQHRAKGIKARKQPKTLEEPDLSQQDETEDITSVNDTNNNDGEKDVGETQPSRPRKSLRVLDDHRFSGPSATKHQRKKVSKTSVTPGGADSIPSTLSDSAMEAVMDELCENSITFEGSSDSKQAAQALAGAVGKRQGPSSSPTNTLTVEDEMYRSDNAASDDGDSSDSEDVSEPIMSSTQTMTMSKGTFSAGQSAPDHPILDGLEPMFDGSNAYATDLGPVERISPERSVTQTAIRQLQDGEVPTDAPFLPVSSRTLSRGPDVHNATAANRKESSSSTFKASSRTATRTFSPHPSSDLEQQLDGTNDFRDKSDDVDDVLRTAPLLNTTVTRPGEKQQEVQYHPDVKADDDLAENSFSARTSQEGSSGTADDVGRHRTGGGVSLSVQSPRATGEPTSARKRRGQLVSPNTSFEDSMAKGPFTPALSQPQLRDETSESKDAATKRRPMGWQGSPSSLRTPELTQQLSDAALPSAKDPQSAVLPSDTESSLYEESDDPIPAFGPEDFV